jgi:hypothetical protein
MLQQERRQSERKPLGQLAFIGLPFDNGGIVIDISDGGLCFHAVAPVDAGRPIHFHFSDRSAAGNRGVGEVVWRDETGKSGGLRFTYLPDEIREQISIWTGQKGSNFSGLQVSAPKDEPTFVPSAEPDSSSTPVVPAPSSDQTPRLLTAHASSLSMFPPEPTSEAVASADTRGRTFYSKFRFSALVLTLISASVVSIGILSYLYMHKSAQSLIRLGEKILGGSHFQ